MPTVLEDTLNEELTDPIRITVQDVFDNRLCNRDMQRTRFAPGKSKTLGKAKSLLEFYDLVRQAIDNYERRSGISGEHKINFTEEDPDVDSQTEVITFSLVKRDPGAFGKGTPFNGTARNLRPMFREEKVDPVNPGYRSLITGYWYDNIVRFVCFARSNKVANARAEWFENLMEEYSWWFKLQGVDRTIFFGRNQDIVVEIDNNKWYGRPIDYFVRTEKIRVFNEKTIEEILVEVKLQTS